MFSEKQKLSGIVPTYCILWYILPMSVCSAVTKNSSRSQFSLRSAVCAASSLQYILQSITSKTDLEKYLFSIRNYEQANSCPLMTSIIFLSPCCILCHPASVSLRCSSSLEENLTVSCNAGCSCVRELYNPVCGADGVMYYSPCHAGCKSINHTEPSTGKQVQYHLVM